jgi:hypothetical protein
MVCGAIFNDIMVGQNIFQWFMVRKLKKFWKHCSRAYFVKKFNLAFVIIWLMGSVMLWPRVIPLNGCNRSIKYSGHRLMGPLWDLDKLIPLTE